MMTSLIKHQRVMYRGSIFGGDHHATVTQVDLPGGFLELTLDDGKRECLQINEALTRCEPAVLLSDQQEQSDGRT